MSDIVTKIKVALLFGGESSEHEVSIKSAASVYSAINKQKYDVSLIYIDKSGKWWLTDKVEPKNDHSLQIASELGGESFIILGTDRKISPDVILPILHGENCEDGCLQGLARLMHIPIAGCGVAASSICMDKALTKQILESNNIKTVPYVVNITGDKMPKFDDLSKILGDTLFVKPAGCGSSVGVSKVASDNQLRVAITEARRFDAKVLIEKAIIGRELEVAMLGNDVRLRASSVGEIIPDREFYDFDSKYSSDSQSKVVIPAEISDVQSKKIQEIAAKAYRLIGCRGFARIDFFLSNDGDIYVNEINTIPGFTSISMFPKLWIEAGLTYEKLIDELIELALE